MSKFKNKTLSSVLALICALALCGCRSSDTLPAETTDDMQQTTLSVTEQSTPAEEKQPLNTVCIEFPAHQFMRTEYNAAVLDIQPFTLSLELPEGWSVQVPDGSEYSEYVISSENSVVYLCNEDHVRVGTVDYDTFELSYEGADADNEIPYRAVYSDLMLSNHRTWDCDYTVVKNEGSVNAATCKILSSAMASGTGEEETTPAALAYNSELFVYVKLSFDDGTVTEAQLEAIARSIDISRS